MHFRHSEILNRSEREGVFHETMKMNTIRCNPIARVHWRRDNREGGGPKGGVGSWGVKMYIFWPDLCGERYHFANTSWQLQTTRTFLIFCNVRLWIRILSDPTLFCPIRIRYYHPDPVPGGKNCVLLLFLIKNTIHFHTVRISSFKESFNGFRQQK